MKSTIKRTICALLVFSMLALMLVACGTPTEETSQPAESQAAESGTQEMTLAEKLEVDPNEEQTITVMSWHHVQARRELMDTTIGRFNEQYPNITIEHSPVEDYIQAYKLAFDSGDGPDICYVDDTTQNLLQRNGYLMDMTDIVHEMGWLDIGKTGTLEYQNIRTPGEYYSVPFLSAPRVVWYNQEILEELNIEPPTTLDEFDVALAAVKEAGYIPFEASVLTLLWHIDGVLFGTTPFEDVSKWYYLEDKTDAYLEGRKAALNKVAEWVELGYFREGVTSVDHNNLSVLFGRGETVFYVTGASASSALSESGLELGAIPFPRVSEDFPITLVDATDSSWAIRADLPEEKLAAAVAFINQFYTAETTQDWVEGGFITTLNYDMSAAELEANAQVALAATENSQIGYFLDNAVPGLLNSMQILNAELLLGEITGDEYDQQIDEEYEKLKAEELAKREE